MLWVSIHLHERKNLCVYSDYEVSIYRYKFMLFITVLPDVFSFPNTPNVINTFHSTCVWDENARKKFQHYWQKLEWTLSFLFKCHGEKTWSWWHWKLLVFSAYNTSMDLIHISHIENQISVKCVHILIVHVCKLTYRVVLIWLENWSWATMAKANNTSMNYRFLFVLWKINQNIM